MIVKPLLKSCLDKNHVEKNGFFFKLGFILVASSMLYRKRMVYHLYTGCAFFLIFYSPKDLFYYFSILALNLALINIVEPKSLKKTAVLVLNVLIIFVGLRHQRTLGISTNSITSIGSEIMLLLPKIFFLSERTSFSTKNALKYIFFVPSLAYGPVVPYEELRKGINRRYRVIVKKALQALSFAAFYLYFDRWITPRDLIITQNRSIFIRILSLYFFTFHYRTKYYFVWSFSSLCFYMCGLEVSNLKFFEVELALRLDKVAVFWNYWIINFFRASCFNPLRHYGAFFAAMATFTFSAMWHGGRSWDFLFLLSFFLAIPILKNNDRFMKKHLSYYVYVPLAIIKTAFFVSYIPVPFYFNSVKNAKKVWANINFLGHIFLVLSLLLQLLAKLGAVDRKASSRWSK